MNLSVNFSCMHLCLLKIPCLPAQLSLLCPSLLPNAKKVRMVEPDNRRRLIQGTPPLTQSRRKV